MTDYFQKFEQGEIRDQILESFRDSLRQLTDPDTGAPPTEDTIRQATILGSRYWVEANDIDLLVQGVQRRGYFLGQQIDPRTASTAFLETFHGPAAGLPRLPATGASGQVAATGTPGTNYIGSTELGDPLATSGADPNGLRYQVYTNGSCDADGNATLTLVAIDTGEQTEIPVGTKIKWINPPPGSTPDASVAGEAFQGGTAAETDQEWGNRIFDARSTRPRAGSPAHFQLWARRSSNAVEQCFVYPCALHAGTVALAIIQKRGTTSGPLARVPSISTMTLATAYLVPPGSPVVPPRVKVLALAARPFSVSLSLRLGLRKASKAGWADAAPWPVRNVQTSAVLAVTSQLLFNIVADTAPPTATPQLMVWNSVKSEFERLNVASVVAGAPGTYNVTLSSAPLTTIAVGSVISPYTSRNDAVQVGIESYFDSFGAGEVVNLTNDVRAARAFRRPTPESSYPYAVGAEVVEYIREALGGSLGGSSLEYASTSVTPIADPSLGAWFFVAGDIGIYPS